MGQIGLVPILYSVVKKKKSNPVMDSIFSFGAATKVGIQNANLSNEQGIYQEIAFHLTVTRFE